MAATNRVLIELYVDDQGTVKIRDATKAVQELGAAGQQGFANSAAAADDFASSLVKQLGIYALAISAAYQLEHAVVGAFKAGIAAVDNYKIAIIAIAASLTDMAKPGQGDMSELFQRNAASAEDMYRAINVEAAKHFAGAHEMMLVYNRLVQGGYNVRLEEVAALGTLADKIKIATQGQNQEVQLNQEIRALLEGQARGYSMLAMELQTRLGPEWSALLEKHKEAGTLLQWLTSLWPGLQVATGKVTETMTSQWTTMKSIAELLAIDSLGGAYQDLVDYMKDVNKYLRENHEILRDDIRKAWEIVSNTISEAYNFVKGIKDISYELIRVNVEVAVSLVGEGSKLLDDYLSNDKNLVNHLNQQKQYWADMKAAATDVPEDFSFEKRQKQFADKYSGLNMYAKKPAPLPGEDIYLGDTSLPGLYDLPKKPVQLQSRAKGDEGGGGKSTEGALNSMQSLVDRLNQDISRLSEGSLAAVDAWYDKTMNDIQKLVAKGADGAEAEALAWDAGSLKKTKIVDDFWLMVDKQTGEGFKAIDDQYQQDLVKYGEIQGAKEALLEIWKKRTYDLEQKYAKDYEDLQKAALSTLAANAPLLSEQLGFQRQIMEVEIKRQQIALDKKIVDDHIPAAQAEELRGLNALADASRRYAQERKEWESQGIGGGLNIWATERQVEMQKRGALQTVEILKGAESWLGDTFGKSALSTMTGQKQQFQKLWQDIMGNALTWVFKQSAKTVFDTGAGLLAPKGDGDPAKQLSKAGKELQKGGQLGIEAGLGFNLNTAQFGLAAGGLLLSGIGIATNSQALVMAGAVLQVAGLIIQVYQMLTAATATTEFTTAAAALTSAATALTSAASALAASAGSSGGGGFLGSFGGLFGAIGAAVLAPFTGGLSLAAEPAFLGGGMAFGGMMGMHQGGVVAPFYAHRGLNTNEVPIIALRGEGVLPIPTMNRLGAAGFEALRSGNFGGDPGGSARPAGPTHLIIPLTINQVSPEGKTLSAHQERLVVDLVKKRIAHREIRIQKH